MNNSPILNLEERLLNSRLWDARMLLKDQQEMHRCTIDTWATILQIIDALEALQPQPETGYLTRDQAADLLGNDAYIHVDDYEDLEAVSHSMRRVYYIVGRNGHSDMYLG